VSFLARQSPAAKIPFQTYCAPLAVMFDFSGTPDRGAALSIWLT